jgi:phosphatidylglycerophosphate synthase
VRYLPFLLTTLRLLLGPVALLLAFTGGPRWIYFPILLIATLSDIYDGVIARHLGIATPALRRYDSITDLIFYLFVLGAAWKLEPALILQNWPWVVAILASELAVIIFCVAKFRRFPATHSYLAKSYGLYLLAVLVAVLVFGTGNWAIISLAIVAIVTNLEILGIHLIMPTPPVDVKSIFCLPMRVK